MAYRQSTPSPIGFDRARSPQSVTKLCQRPLPAGVVFRRRENPSGASASVPVRHHRRHFHPVMSSVFEQRLGRRGKRRIGERADKDRDETRHRCRLREDRRATDRAEVERPRHATVRDAFELAALAGGLHLILPESRSAPERASGAPLARKAMAHVHEEGVTLGGYSDLATAAGGAAAAHGAQSRHRVRAAPAVPLARPASTLPLQLAPRERQLCGEPAVSPRRALLGSSCLGASAP